MDRRASLEARALWAILELFADKDGTHCNPTLQRLADECDRSFAWVRQYLGELERLEWISQRPGWNEKTQMRCLNITIHHGTDDQCSP